MRAHLLHPHLGGAIALRALGARQARDRIGPASAVHRFHQPLAAPGGTAPRPAGCAHRRHARMLRAPAREVEHQFVVHHLEDGQVGGLRLALAPVPELAQQRQRLGAEEGRTTQAPLGLGIALAHELAGGDDARAGLFVPREAALFRQLPAHLLRDGLKVLGVLHGVIDHRLGKRAARPVGLLAAFVERDATVLLDERAVAERAQAEQLRGQHGVEDGLRFRRARAAQHAQVEIGAVQEPGVAAGGRPEFIQRKLIQRVDEEMLPVVRDLDQADALAVVVQAVGLGIERNGKVAAQAADEIVERLWRVDPDELDLRRHEAFRMAEDRPGMKKEVRPLNRPRPMRAWAGSAAARVPA